MGYDAFLSYSHSDLAWAEKFHSDLLKNDPKLDVFVDKTAIRAGDAWLSKIEDGLKSARCLIVLWSEKIDPTSWVWREINAFRTTLSNHPERRLIIVVLSGNPPPYGEYHFLTELKDAGVYLEPPEKLSDRAAKKWTGVVDKTLAAMHPNLRTTIVRYAVLAMNAMESAGLTGHESAGLGSLNLKDCLARLYASNHTAPDSLDTLRTRYGPERRNWRPFDGANTIEQVLLERIDEINHLVAEHDVRFELQEAALVADPDDAEEAARQLRRGPAIVLIDPLSLCHHNVRPALGFLERCVHSEHLLIQVLTPYPEAVIRTELKAYLRKASAPHFDFHFSPDILLTPRLLASPRAMCDVAIEEPASIQRMIQHLLGRSTQAATPATRNPALDMIGT